MTLANYDVLMILGTLLGWQAAYSVGQAISATVVTVTVDGRGTISSSMSRDEYFPIWEGPRQLRLGCC